MKKLVLLLFCGRLWVALPPRNCVEMQGRMEMDSRDCWLHRFAVFTAGATLFLIVAGGLVTSTGSGLAVPDWPLSYGGVFPPMAGGIFYVSFCSDGYEQARAFCSRLEVLISVLQSCEKV